MFSFSVFTVSDQIYRGQMLPACPCMLPDCLIYCDLLWLMMESCLPLLFAPKGTGISCSNLRLVWPALCIIGKCSWLGSVRSFLEFSFFLFFFSITCFSICCSLNNSRSPPIDFVDLGTLSPELSFQKWSKGLNLLLHFQLVSALWATMH